MNLTPAEFEALRLLYSADVPISVRKQLADTAVAKILDLAARITAERNAQKAAKSQNAVSDAATLDSIVEKYGMTAAEQAKYEEARRSNTSIEFEPKEPSPVKNVVKKPIIIGLRVYSTKKAVKPKHHKKNKRRGH